MTKVYLIESTSVTQNGNLQGKSLRTYEVTLHETTTKYGHKMVIPKPTGKMYIIKEGKVICKNTTATLSNKHLYYSSTVHNTIDKGVNYWGCSIFVSPHIALAAKHRAITTRSNTVLETLHQHIATVEKTISEIEDASFIANDYPELFI